MEENQISGCHGLGMSGKGLTAKMPTVMELFYILIVVVLLHIHVNIHQIIYLERMNFTECKLYLHKLALNCLAFH